MTVSVAVTMDKTATEAITRQPGAVCSRGAAKVVRLPDSELTILHDVTLEITPSEQVAIVGTSGSGKSTLLSLLAGLDLPSRGEVWLDGQRIDAASEDVRAALRARAVGFVFQSFQLLPSMTALDNVALPLELRGEAGADRAREVLEHVGLGQRLHHLPRQLSGGEQQRVAIARAFVTRPRILFADEPTGNLDRRTGLAIEDLLFELNAQHRTTLVLVTHDERLAGRCARQLHLEEGRLLA